MARSFIDNVVCVFRWVGDHFYRAQDNTSYLVCIQIFLSKKMYKSYRPIFSNFTFRNVVVFLLRCIHLVFNHRAIPWRCPLYDITKFCVHFSVWSLYIKRNEVIFCCITKYYEKVI